MLINLIRSLYYKYYFSRKTPHELIRLRGGKVGEGVFIGKGVLIDYDYAFLLDIGEGAVISARSIIELHDSCIPNVSGHGKLKIGKVKIGVRAYIGVNSALMPGIHIGDQAIVGACSLVNRDIPSREVWAGNPIRFLCTVDELTQKRINVESSSIGYFDWIGEIEKKELNYELYKKNFIDQVRRHFREIDSGF